MRVGCAALRASFVLRAPPVVGASARRPLLGCCWVLMALLFVGGVMNVLWIALLALLIRLEKLTPVAEIFNGANPANIPISQPTKYELCFNLNTAKALGIEIPPSLLVQADKVIE